MRKWLPFAAWGILCDLWRMSLQNGPPSCIRQPLPHNFRINFCIIIARLLHKRDNYVEVMRVFCMTWYGCRNRIRSKLLSGSFSLTISFAVSYAKFEFARRQCDCFANPNQFLSRVMIKFLKCGRYVMVEMFDASILSVNFCSTGLHNAT